MKELEKDLLMMAITIVVLSVSLVIGRVLVLAIIPLLLFLFPSQFHLKVQGIYFNPPTHVGDEVILNLNTVIFGLGYAKISMNVEDLMEVIEGNPKTGGFVPFFRKFRISVKGKATKRGEVNFGRISVRFNDVFLLKETRKDFNVDATAEVKVKVKKVRKVKARRQRVKESYPDIDISKIGVPGTDFREIRKYIPGDPVKFINWKATAKRNEILVNEFEVEGKRAIWFVVNTSDYIFNEREYLENALTTTASLAYYFSKRGHKIALTLTGSGKTLHPDMGKKQFYRVMRELTIAEFGRKTPLMSVKEAKKLIMYHMPFVLYLTNIHDDLMALNELKKLGLKCKLIVVEGKEYHNDLARTAFEILLRGKLRKDADIVKDTVRVRM